MRSGANEPGAVTSVCGFRRSGGIGWLLTAGLGKDALTLNLSLREKRMPLGGAGGGRQFQHGHGPSVGSRPGLRGHVPEVFNSLRVARKEDDLEL